MIKLNTLMAVFALGCSAAVTAANDAGDVPLTDTPLTDTPLTDTPLTDTPLTDTPRVDAVITELAITDTPRVDAVMTDLVITDTPRPGRVPMRHRAVAEVCPALRPPGGCMVGGGGPPVTCMTDSVCTTGVNGRCIGNPRDGCRCSYDQCQDDNGCTTAGPCVCRLSSRGASGANVCLGGNCRLDSNCGPGGYCSPTLGDCGDYGGVVGFYCHTAADECIDDADCTRTDAGFLGQPPYCAYNRETGRWRCSNNACAG